jgi:Skp family chaperone for outer membrane proteins
MKNIILSLLTVFAFVTINAQEKPAPKGKAQVSPEQRVERRLNKLNEVSGGLSDAQKVRVKAILEEHDKQAEADRQKFAGDKEKMKEAQKNRRANSDARLKEVLSPEQYEKVMAHRKEMQQKHQQNKGGKGQGQGQGQGKKAGKNVPKPADDDKDEIYD